VKGDFYMSRHKVDISGVNTANIKVLTSEENKKLFERMKEGDQFARDDLIQGNLKLVLSCLKQFAGKVDNMDDLFQVGCLGLVKAIDNFDISYDVKLSTYACPMILGEIKRYLRDNSSLRISRSVKDIAYKTLKLKEELMGPDGKEPTNLYIANILGISEYEVSNALDSLREPVSMYEPIYNDGGDTIYLYDQISNKKEEYDLDYKLAIKKAMDKLKLRDRQILESRFIVGKTQMEIASELGISQAQISRIEKNAINNIKKYVK
jgi:RNA polymerase sporulation-specific sigma factor